MRHRAPGEPRALAARHERHALLVAQAHDAPHLVRGGRQHGHARFRAQLHEAVGLVRQQLAVVAHDAVGAHDLLEIGEKRPCPRRPTSLAWLYGLEYWSMTRVMARWHTRQNPTGFRVNMMQSTSER